MAFTRRLLITFVTPVLVVLLGSRLLLPGIDGLGDLAYMAPERFSVFALGVYPYVAGYQLVEIVAFLIPSLSRRRHGDPRMRAKLDMAVHVVTLVLAAFQAYSFAMELRLVMNDSPYDAGSVSVPIVMVTLVGGVCVQIVLAKTITRARLANGVAVLFAANVLHHVIADVTKRLEATPPSQGHGGLMHLFITHEAATPMETLVTVAALAILVAATAVALARATGMRLGPGPAEGGPYRGARALVLHPSYPVPASSYGAIAIARSLVFVPALVARTNLPGAGTLSFLSDSGSGVLFTFVLVVMVGLAFWIHRPRELADLSQRLGIKTDPKEARRSLVHALLPSFLFFAVALLATQAAGVDLTEAPVFVAVVLDLVVSVRHARTNEAWTPIWEERRATAVPVVRAVLAARGITSQVDGTSLLWLMQIFAPFAPAVISVKEADAEAAQKILGNLAFSTNDAATAAAPVTIDTPELTPRRRAVYLAGLVAVAGGLAVVAGALRSGAFEPHVTSADPVSELTLVRIDDTYDPLATFADSDIPEGSGISIYGENAPIGSGAMKVHYARIIAKTGEPKSETRARLRRFLDTIKLQPSKDPVRFGLEEVSDIDDDTRKVSFIGYRSFVLLGDAELTNADVDDAMVTFDRDTQEPSVAVTLSPEGARRFEDVTERWVNRRLAIVLDGEIQSAPVIKSKIGGGHLTISMGRGEPEKNLSDARRLERSLRGRTHDRR